MEIIEPFNKATLRFTKHNPDDAAILAELRDILGATNPKNNDLGIKVRDLLEKYKVAPWHFGCRGWVDKIGPRVGSIEPGASPENRVRQGLFDLITGFDIGVVWPRETTFHPS